MTKRPNAFLALGFALFLISFAADPVSAQISDEKKRNLRKFDPSDIFPDAREADQGQKDKGDSKSKSKKGDRKRGEQEEVVGETKPVSTPSPRSNPSPTAPVLNTSQPSTPSAPPPVQAAAAEQKQSPAAPENTTGSTGTGLLSLPILFALVIATLGGLVATILKLLKLSSQLGLRGAGAE